jgi:hypothetical protein
MNPVGNATNEALLSMLARNTDVSNPASLAVLKDTMNLETNAAQTLLQSLDNSNSGTQSLLQSAVKGLDIQA